MQRVIVRRAHVLGSNILHAGVTAHVSGRVGSHTSVKVDDDKIDVSSFGVESGRRFHPMYRPLHTHSQHRYDGDIKEKTRAGWIFVCHAPLSN